MPRGYRSRHRDTHEIMLSVLYLGLGSRVWLQYCIILNSVLKLLGVWIDVTWFIVASRTGSSREVHLGRGLGSGTVQTAGAIKHLFVRLAWLSHKTGWPEALGFRFSN